MADFTLAFGVSNFSDRVLRVLIAEDGYSFCDTAILALRSKDIPISSEILAEKSRFFLKLFSNGMRESGESHVTIQIEVSEEEAFMDLLRFMYTNTLSASNNGALLNVMLIADKFEVVSCIQYCCHLLCNSEMSLDSALLYLELQSNPLMLDAAQPLVKASKRFIELRYTYYTKCRDEILKLPIAGFEVVVANDDFCAPTEDAVLQLVLTYVNTHYTSVEERRNVFQTRLSQHIRYKFLSCPRLRELLTVKNFVDPEFISSVVTEALFLKTDTYNKHTFMEGARNWTFLPVRIMEFELSQPQCDVFLEVKRTKCAKLYPEGNAYFEEILFNEDKFLLALICSWFPLVGSHCLGLYLASRTKFSESKVCSIDYKFSVLRKPEGEFEDRWEDTFSFTEGNRYTVVSDLLGITWEEFMSDDCKYFINDILHLKVEFKGRQLPPQQ